MNDMDLVARAAREALYDFQHGDDENVYDREYNLAGELSELPKLQQVTGRMLYRRTYRACQASYAATIYREQKA